MPIWLGVFGGVRLMIAVACVLALFVIARA